jgi:predicted nucleic acid-binding protein
MARRSEATLRLLIDTNVILDVALAREPWARDGAVVLEAIGRGLADGFVAAHAVSTVHYIVEKQRDRATASTAIGDLLSLLAVAPLGTADFHRALTIGLRDFEDAIQVAAALAVDATFLVTRNERDFKGAPVACRTPGEIVGLLPSLGEAREGS